MSTYSGLPVAGYRPQSSEAVDLVNANKLVEETILRTMDDLAKGGNCDLRWLAIARTQMEQAFMSLNRSIFRPDRVSLPFDPSEASDVDPR